METPTPETTQPTPIPPSRPSFTPGNNRLGRILGGLIIVTAGSFLFAHKAGVYFPAWLFSFDTFLIVLGLFIWARHSFRRPGGLILVLIGGLLLLNDIIPNLYIGHFFWPIIIIVAGLGMIFTSGRNHQRWSEHKMRRARRWRERHHQNFSRFSQDVEGQTPGANPLSEESYIDSTAIFGGVKKNFFTKDFKGGEVVNFMGGTELNLSQAEIQGPVTLEISQVFGGTKLIIPSHWQLRSEIVAVMGGVDDKRPVHQNTQEDPTRILILRGTTVFGGIDIKSF